jgi:hypothetical protein
MEGNSLSSKHSIRKSINLVVDTVEILDNKYKHNSLIAAANRLADHCESGNIDTYSVSLIKDFLDSIPFSFSGDINQILEYMKERYGYNGGQQI